LKRHSLLKQGCSSLQLVNKYFLFQNKTFKDSNTLVSTMKLCTALSIVLLGTTSPVGSAFASSNRKGFITSSTYSRSTSTSTGKYHKQANAFLSNRGGASNIDSSISAVTKETSSTDAAVTSFISQENWELLSPRGQTALANLIKGDVGIGAQEHVYANWPDRGTDDEGKIKLAEQVSYTQFSLFV
jgi:hypothetical protein